MKKILLINFVVFISILIILEISARIFLKIKLGDQNAGLPMRNKNLEYKPFVMYGENWDQIFKNFINELNEDDINVLLIGGSTAENFPDEIFVPINVSQQSMNKTFNSILTKLSRRIKEEII